MGDSKASHTANFRLHNGFPDVTHGFPELEAVVPMSSLQVCWMFRGADRLADLQVMSIYFSSSKALSRPHEARFFMILASL